jgi:hypothetical protein
MIKTEDNLRYATCLLACAIAGIDGRIQDEEKHQLQTIINQELVLNSKSFRYAGILANLIQHGQTLRPNHEWALGELKRNEKVITPQFKEQIVKLMQRVAETFPPVTPEESVLAQKIKQEIDAIGAPQAQG